MSPNKEPNPITIVVDGVEIEANEGAMLVDAAKHGDVEIPVFCYEPKLGDPVGACRMCLVEIEGIPKLQTACSTPVRDGMVVYTQTDRVKEAQNAVVEFLLVNHPLDCPVCDKGGECPLQDIAMGWGPGKSRVTDPKRHFQKPIPLSPLIRIDRERCILCYRCVRFSQEVSEDEQLQLLERGAKTFVGTHEDRPYIGPFHGNIIELCPVGALTSQAYRFRARPWDIEDAGSVCTLCPSQCNVKFTVRDEKVVRALARDNEAVDDGWLCDKGRFGYQMFSSPDRPVTPQVRSGGGLEPASWEEALEKAAAGLAPAVGRTAAIVGGGTSNEEGWLIQRLVRGTLGSGDVAATRRRGLSRSARARLGDPKLSVATADIDHAGAILVLGCDPMNEMPILELRIRKAVRRNGSSLLVATERPTALDGGAAIGSAGCLEAQRYAPGEARRFIDDLRAAIGSGDTDADAAGFADALRDAGPVVVVWGEGILAGEDREQVADSLLALADVLGLDGAEGAGLYEVPDAANARGLREVGCAEDFGPGLSETAPGRSADEIRDALEAGEIDALILSDVDPIRDFDDPEGWRRALSAAKFTLSISMFAGDLAQASHVHLPAESHAEKEGTVTHPDGRLQRVRPSVPHPGTVRPLWQALSELSARLGDDPGAGTAGEVFDLLAAEV
ncbi:MAG: NADH-quinone oxidoreductase subunit NuoG, partial [Solirubrobacterales bacterium]|nr:NADH-quinone oxidoreductase subunit NuoG [Solirubrobacterales bacterium]